MSAKQLMFVAIASILTIVGIVAIVVMDSDGDVAGDESQTDSNRVSYSIIDYATGEGTEYVFDVVGYATPDGIENNHTNLSSSNIDYIYSDEPSPYIYIDKKGYGQDIRIPVIYSASVGGNVANYYLVEYKLLYGVNYKPYFGSLSFRSVTYADGVYTIGDMTTVGDKADPVNPGIAIVPSTFTVTIPDDFTLNANDGKIHKFEGKTTYSLSSVGTVNGTPCLKTLIILGSPTLSTNLVRMNSLETVIFGGGSLSFSANASMVSNKIESSLTNIYFDTVEASTLLAQNVICRQDDQAINIYLKSGEWESQGKPVRNTISDKFGSGNYSIEVNIYFSKDSILPIGKYGNSTADRCADNVVFHVHKDTTIDTTDDTTDDTTTKKIKFWSLSDPVVASVIDSEDVAPEVFEYPAYKVTVSDCENGSVSVATNYKPGDYALPGSTVALYPIPADGYIVESITYTCDGVATAVSRSDDGKYYFTMPSKNVSIGAVFKEALPKIESACTSNGSQLDISLTLTGSYSDKIPDKVCVYVKYANADSTEAYSFAKMTVRISNYSSGYALSVTSSMSSLTPIEYLIQVYSGDTMVSNVLKEV